MKLELLNYNVHIFLHFILYFAELTETAGGRSPELLIAKDGVSSNGVSPRHSVSSNSSNGSTCVSTKDSVKADK